MPTVDFIVETPVSTSIRARQVSAMFDVPATDKCRLSWRGDVPIEDEPWNVGLIVGPSGSGKTSIMRQMFGEMAPMTWSAPSVVDDFSSRLSVQEITDACAAVGFNTIPAWLRPYAVLSNGEKFRVDLARRLIELPDPIVVDEFTSVVDRQVAQIGSHAVQKYARRTGRRFVAVSCHYDIIEWLQPDWILEAATMQFSRRLLQRRPRIECHLSRVDWSAWRLFAPYHYLTAEMNRSASCFALFVGDRPVTFSGMLYRPHPHADNIMGCSRLVTLPDWQGVGLAFVLINAIGAAYKATGMRARTYPAHPALIRAFDKSSVWKMTKKPGTFSGRMGAADKDNDLSDGAARMSVKETRPSAVFEYVGPAMDRMMAERFLSGQTAQQVALF